MAVIPVWFVQRAGHSAHRVEEHLGRDGKLFLLCDCPGWKFQIRKGGCVHVQAVNAFRENRPVTSGVSVTIAEAPVEPVAAATKPPVELEVPAPAPAVARADSDPHIKLPVDPMLAEWADPPKDGKFGYPFVQDGQWAYEIKWDGWRLVAQRLPNGGTGLYTRAGTNYTEQFPEILGELLLFPVGTILDGEVVVMEGGKSSFQALQNHRSLTNAGRQQRLRYVVFDVLAIAGRDVRALPFVERKALLKDLLADPTGTGEVSKLQFVVFGAYGIDGKAAWALVEQYHLEGLVAKPLTGRYLVGQRGPWLKLKRTITEEFLVVGYQEGAGRRAGTIGALVLAEPGKDGGLRIVGNCGTGFTDATLDRLMAHFRPLVVPAKEMPRGLVTQMGSREVIWLREPQKATIEYAERTNAGGVRGPASFKGMGDIR